jgi:hypothetical protein
VADVSFAVVMLAEKIAECRRFHMICGGEAR